MPKFKPGDRVVVNSIFYKFTNESGTVLEESEVPWVRFDNDERNRDLNNKFTRAECVHETNLILETIFNSRLYKALQEDEK